MEFGFISSPNDSVFCLQSHWNNIGRGLKIKLLEILHFRGWEMRKERWWRHERRNSIRKMGFTVFQSLSHIWLFATPWSASCQTSLSFTLSQSLLKPHVHWVSDAVQPSHPLLPLFPLVLNLSHHQGLFQWIGSSHQVTKVLELQHQSFQWIIRVDFL